MIRQVQMYPFLLADFCNSQLTVIMLSDLGLNDTIALIFV